MSRFRETPRGVIGRWMGRIAKVVWAWLSFWKPRWSGESAGPCVEHRSCCSSSGCGPRPLPQAASPAQLPLLHRGSHQAGVVAQICLTLVEGLGAGGQAPRGLPAAHSPSKTLQGSRQRSSDKPLALARCPGTPDGLVCFLKVN